MRGRPTTNNGAAAIAPRTVQRSARRFAPCVTFKHAAWRQCHGWLPVSTICTGMKNGRQDTRVFASHLCVWAFVFSVLFRRSRTHSPTHARTRARSHSVARSLAVVVSPVISGVCRSCLVLVAVCPAPTGLRGVPPGRLGASCKGWAFRVASAALPACGPFRVAGAAPRACAGRPRMAVAALGADPWCSQYYRRYIL